MKTGCGLPDRFEADIGVRQGCILGSYFFLMVIDHCMFSIIRFPALVEGRRPRKPTCSTGPSRCSAETVSRAGLVRIVQKRYPDSCEPIEDFDNFAYLCVTLSAKETTWRSLKSGSAKRWVPSTHWQMRGKRRTSHWSWKCTSATQTFCPSCYTARTH